jgi:predicted HAD superfamily Cof-like phosphohydrolase
MNNMQSNFQKIIEFHKAFGLQHKEEPQTEVFDDKKLVDLRVSLIEEEVGELKDAIKERDFTEVIDALGDILYVVYGAGTSFGIDLDKAFSLIHDSNMTKLCKTEEEAIQTVEWYKANENRYDSPTYRLSDDKKYYVVYNKSTGKILKSINYSPVKFDSMLSN